MEKFSRIIAGFWRLQEWNMHSQQLLSFINQCIDLRITSFDHADIYGGYECEALFGEALKLESSIRKKMQLVTKCGIKLVSSKFPGTKLQHYDTGKSHIIASVEQSLKNFNTDYIDLLLIHRPDPFMDAEETAEAFSQLKEEGKVLSFGVSNFLPSQYDLLSSKLPFPLITNQVEFSPLCMNPLDDGTFDQCQRLGISPMAWSPFAGGKLFSGKDEQNVRMREALQEISKCFEGTSIDQIALAWILNHPVKVYPVLGTGKIDRIKKALKAMDIQLTREQWFSVWCASKGHGVP